MCTVILSGMVCTPKWLIWASWKENEKHNPGVLLARLRDIRVQDYERSASYKLIQDSGLEISGLHTGAADSGSSFIGLGSEPAAQKFRVILKDAVDKAS